LPADESEFDQLSRHPERSRLKGGVVEGPFLPTQQQKRSLRFASLRSAPVGMTGAIPIANKSQLRYGALAVGAGASGRRFEGIE
jgi:hypothetical protein